MCYFAIYISGVLLGIIIIICDFRANKFTFNHNYFVFVLTISSWAFVISLTDIWSSLIIKEFTKLYKRIK